MVYSDALDPDGFHVDVAILKKRKQGAAGELPADSEVLPQGAKRIRVGTPAATQLITSQVEAIDVTRDDTPQQTQPDGTQQPLRTALGERISTQARPRRPLAPPTSDTTTTPQQGPAGKGGSRLGPGTAGGRQATIVPGIAGKMALGATIADEPALPVVSPAHVGKNKTPSGPPADKKAGKAATGAGTGKAAAAGKEAPVPEVGRDIALPWWVKNYFSDYKGSPADWRSLYPDAFQFPSSDIDEDTAYSADTVTLKRQPGYKDYKTEFLAEQQRLSKEHTEDSPPPQPSDDFIAAQVARIAASWDKLLEDAKHLVRVEASDKTLMKSRAAKAAEAKAAKEAAKAAKEAPKISAATVPAATVAGTQPATVPELAVLSGAPRVAGTRKERVTTAHVIASLLDHTRYQSELLERREELLRKATLAGQRLYSFKKAAEEFNEIKSELDPDDYDLSPKLRAIMAYLFSMLKVRSSVCFNNI